MEPEPRSSRVCSAAGCDAPALDPTPLCWPCIGRIPTELRLAILGHKPGEPDRDAALYLRACRAAERIAAMTCRRSSCSELAVPPAAFCSSCSKQLPLELIERLALYEPRAAGAPWSSDAAARWMGFVDTAAAVLDAEDARR